MFYCTLRDTILHIFLSLTQIWYKSKNILSAYCVKKYTELDFQIDELSAFFFGGGGQGWR